MPHVLAFITSFGFLATRNGQRQKRLGDMIRTFTLTILASLILFGNAVQTSEPPAPERRVLYPFDFKGVTVESGFLKRQIDGVKAFYLEIPNDDLLRGFRVRAGQPAPGKPLGGWYNNDLFHIFGQIISGLSRLYAATG